MSVQLFCLLNFPSGLEIVSKFRRPSTLHHRDILPLAIVLNKIVLQQES